MAAAGELAEGQGAIRVGLGKVKWLRRDSVERLLEARGRYGRFRSVSEFLHRVRPGSGETEALLLCGALDGLTPLAGRADPLLRHELLARIQQGSADSRFAAVNGTRPENSGDLAATFRALVGVRDELRFLDMCVSTHPLEVLRLEAAAACCVPIAEALASDSGLGEPEGDRGKLTRVAGLIAASRRVRLQVGQVMQFLTLEDESGLLEVVLDPPAYERLGSVITTPGPFLAAGRLCNEDGDVQLHLSRLKPFYERPKPYGLAPSERVSRLGSDSLATETAPG